MARLDWDRLRRIQPLDGADPRLDPDGAVLWEREMGDARGEPKAARSALDPSAGVRRLRAGIVVRRVRERREADAASPDVSQGPPTPALQSPTPPQARMPLEPSAWIECPRCRAWVPRKKLLLHARASCTRKG